MTGSHTGIGLAEGAFTAYMGLCGCVFIFAPHMPIADSFGALAVPGTEAHTIALVCEWHHTASMCRSARGRLPK